MADNKAGGPISEARLVELLSVLVAKEARLAEKEQMLEEQIKARDEERKRESERYTVAKIQAQTNCKHMKGGKGRTKGQHRDPAVFYHTFADGTPMIKCLLCGAKWLKGDTVEFLKRNGGVIPNWTGIGWREAGQMVEDSSNKPSSSERFFADQATKEIKEFAHEASQAKNLQI